MLISPVDMVWVVASTFVFPPLRLWDEEDRDPSAMLVTSVRIASSFSILSTRSKLPSAKILLTNAMESVNEAGWELTSLFEPLSEEGVNSSLEEDNGCLVGVEGSWSSGVALEAFQLKSDPTDSKLGNSENNKFGNLTYVLFFILK